MPQTIEVKGLGEFEFDDNLSDADIDRIVNEEIIPAYSQNSKVFPPESQLKSPGAMSLVDKPLEEPWFNPIDAAVTGAAVPYKIGAKLMRPVVGAGLNVFQDAIVGSAAEALDTGESKLLPLVVNLVGGVGIGLAGDKLITGVTNLSRMTKEGSESILGRLTQKSVDKGLQKGTPEFADDLVKETQKEIREQLELHLGKPPLRTPISPDSNPYTLGKPGEFLGAPFEPSPSEQMELLKLGKGLKAREYKKTLEEEAKLTIARTKQVTAESLEKGSITKGDGPKPGLEQYISKEATMNKTVPTRAIYVGARKAEATNNSEINQAEFLIDEMLKEGGVKKLPKGEDANVFLALEGKYEVGKLSESGQKAFATLQPKVKKLLDTLLIRYGRMLLTHRGAPEKDVAAISNIDNLQELFVKYKIPIQYLDNYMPHIFQGDYWFKVDGKRVQSFQTEMGALKAAEEHLAQNPNAKIEVTSTPVFTNDDAVFLTRKGYERFVSRIKNVLSKGEEVPVLTREDIVETLQGVARPLPQYKFVGNFLDRIADNPNYEKDIEKALKLYSSSVIRKTNIDSYLRLQEKELGSMGPELSEMKRYVKNVFEPVVVGRPGDFDRAISNTLNNLGLPKRTLDKVVGGARNFQFVADMGYSMVTAVAQTAQQMNTLAVVGPKHFNSYKRIAELAFSKSGKGQLKEAFDQVIHEATLVGHPVEHITQLFSPTGLFRATELGNRVGAYLSGKSLGGELYDTLKKGTAKQKASALQRIKLLVPETDDLYNKGSMLAAGGEVDKRIFEIETAIETVNRTQGQYGKIITPPILDTALARLIAPYKQFLINQMELTYRLAVPHPINAIKKGSLRELFPHPKEGLMFLGAYGALAGVYGNPVLYGYMYAFDKAQKMLWPEDESVLELLERKGYHSGLIGKLGADISGTLTVNLPTKASELIGRVAKLPLSGYDYVKGRLEGRPAREEWNLLTRDALPSQARRAIEAYGIAQTGEITNWRTDELLRESDDPSWDATMTLLGIKNPDDVATLRRGYDLKQKEAISRAVVKDYRGDLALAISRGDVEEMDKTVDDVLSQLEDSISLFESATSEKRRMEAMAKAMELTEILNEARLKQPLLGHTIDARMRAVMGAPKRMRPLASEMLPQADEE